MRLTKNDIGKMVRVGYTEPSRRVVFVEGDCVWLKDGAFNAVWNCEGEYEFVEEPKKPSERIDELYCAFQTTEGSAYLRAIIQYLDEQFEKEKGK